MKKYLFALAVLSLLTFQTKVNALIGEIVDDAVGLADDAVTTAGNVTDDILHLGNNHHIDRSYYDSDQDYIVGLESENDRLRAENNRLRRETSKIEYAYRRPDRQYTSGRLYQS